jgi:hypothetical protein
MDSLEQLLAGHIPEEPPEIAAIKAYVAQHFNQPVKVGLQNDVIIISARSAAFIGTLRMRTRQISQAAQTEKRLVFRIG